MTKYLKAHEEFIKQKLLADDPAEDWEALREMHLQRIEFMQHERLIHLLVTLSFAIMLIICLGIAFMRQDLMVLVLMLLLLSLLIPYIYHYFTLENGVQRWYLYYGQIEEKTRKEKGC